MADSDSLENPDLLVSCHASSKPMAGSSFEDVASNKRPCRSFSARLLLLMGFFGISFIVLFFSCLSGRLKIQQEWPIVLPALTQTNHGGLVNFFPIIMFTIIRITTRTPGRW